MKHLAVQKRVPLHLGSPLMSPYGLHVSPNVGEHQDINEQRFHGTSRDWQLEQTATRMCGGEEHVTSAVNCKVSWGAASLDKNK